MGQFSVLTDGLRIERVTFLLSGQASVRGRPLTHVNARAARRCLVGVNWLNSKWDFFDYMTSMNSILQTIDECQLRSYYGVK